MIKIEIEKNKNVLQKGLKQEIEKHIKDPVFMALVKKYAKESEEFNKNKSKIDKEHDKIIKRVFQRKKYKRFSKDNVGNKRKNTK